MITYFLNLQKVVHFIILKLLPIFILFSHISLSQVSDIAFDHKFFEQGLSQSIVKCIFQDRIGFMYFGTEDGLNIYDGYSFKVLRKQSDDQNSLSYNDITTMCEDDSGGIWIGTFNSGVNLLNPETKKIIRFNFDFQNQNSISNDNINAVIHDKEGNIWIGTDNGLSEIKRSKEGKHDFVINRGIQESEGKTVLNTGRILSLLCDKNGSLWVGTQNGLYKYSKSNTKYFLSHKFSGDSQNRNDLSNSTVKCLFEDSNGDIWIGTENGLNKLSNEKSSTGTIIKYYYSPSLFNSISQNDITAICEDASGLIWIGTNGGGINIFDKKRNKFYSYQHDPLDDRSISVNEIRSLFLDRSGIIWIGTYGGGLNKVSRGTGQFYHYKYRANDPNTLSHSIIWSFFQDKDSILWIGTHNGLDKLNRKTNTYHHFLHSANQNSLSNNVVRVITPIGQDKLMIGTNGGGVDEFDIKTGNFKNWSHNPDNDNSLILNEIRAIYKDKDGIIWIGTYGKGMDRFDPVTNSFKHYYNIPGDTNSLSQDYVRVIVEDNNGYLWVGTEGGGLNRFDKEKEQFVRYRQQPGNPKSISSDYIFSILIDSKGNMWLGTYGGGLDKFNPVTGEYKNYTVSDGLPSNSIYGILEDKNTNYWMSTNNGLSRFNPVTEKFKNYNAKEGLQNNEFNGGSYYKTYSGELLFGGINGFNAFYPENIKDNSFIPPVVITSFKKFNEEVEFKEPLTSIKEIELHYSENVFSFEFAALDFSSPGKNKYAYKLKGVDKDWVYVDADKRYAAYTTLSPGEYSFLVKGSNSDGLWNQQATQIIIRIIPPFWQRAWFIILVLLIIAGIAYLLYLRRLRIIRMKIELQTAHDAQLSIMPKSDPVNENLEVSGICIPANEVGGDFFDYFWLDDGHKKFGIMIGDVSGKAMKAAVTAILTSGMIISEIRSNKTISNILENVNTSLINKIEKNMFVSLCLCVIDTENKLFYFSNAGLNRPIIKSNAKIEFLQSEGPRLPLGVQNNLSYKQNNVIIKSGDIIILTTDGVSEAQNNSRELFGDERLVNALLKLNTEKLTALEIKNSIITEVRGFTKSKKPMDDMTVLIIKIK